MSSPAKPTPAKPLLIVPGYRGSGPDHWQTWLESQVDDSVRIDGIKWDEPVLANWAERVREALAGATQPLWVIAHSFGCLAAVVAAADRPEQVAKLILVAPADPERFDFTGLKMEAPHNSNFSLAEAVPRRSLQVGGSLIASRDDPWLEFAQAAAMANDWGLDLHDAGAAGHINADSGHGPWPWLLTLLEQHTQHSSQTVTPAANTGSGLKKGRGSTLAAVRQLTRLQLEKPHSRKSRQ